MKEYVVEVQQIEASAIWITIFGIGLLIIVKLIQGMLANTKLNIAEKAMERGWKYSPRLHVDLFGSKWGT